MAETISNTGENRQGQFQKGDPRINRKGRPKSFDALRKLAQQIAHEVALEDDRPLVISGHLVTVAESILRSWATSKNPILQKAYIEIAFGKVPDNINLNGNLTILPVKGVNYRAAIANLAPRPMGDSDAPGESESPLDGKTVG